VVVVGWVDVALLGVGVFFRWFLIFLSGCLLLVGWAGGCVGFVGGFGGWLSFYWLCIGGLKGGISVLTYFVVLSQLWSGRVFVCSPFGASLHLWS